MNIGLVLSGGMAKGAYQIGALKAISEHIPYDNFKYISGSSIGALNGYSFIVNKLHEAERVWRKVCNTDSRILVSKILRSSFLQNAIEDIYSESDVLQTTFYISLLDFDKKEVIYKNLKDVCGEQIPMYLKASVAMPIYNRAIQIDNHKFFDGALVDNIPVFPLLKHSLDYMICIYFDDCCYKFENTYFDNKIIKITFPVRNVLKDSVLFQKDSIDEMLSLGYQTASYLLEGVFAKGIEDIEYICDYISFHNLNTENRKLRITGDVLVTNVNKVTQRLAKRKIII